MTPYIDLQRRFHHLSETQQTNQELLAAIGEYRGASDIGWQELLEHPRVVILAEAGAGKTTEMKEQMERLLAAGRAAFFIPLEALAHESVESVLSSPDVVAMLAGWKASPDAPAWFFLDAVDELKLSSGKLDRALQRLATAINAHLDRAWVVISCRPYDWRAHFDLATVRERLPLPPRVVSDAPIPPADAVFLDALRRDRGKNKVAPTKAQPSHGDVNVVGMLPMSDRQIRLFAERSGVQDPEAFLAEVERQNAWDFARRPFDLVELIATWISSGQLGTRAQQHEANIAAKLKDDPDRPDHGVLNDVLAREGAERLALAIALTRARTIRAPDQALDVTRAEGVLNAHVILPNWTEAQRQSLLRRGLFDPATYGRVRFHHRSVQEFLAARCLYRLREKGMSTKALLRLLFAEQYGEEVVFPSMRAIAAWLALWNRDVLRELMRREPEVLLTLGDPESLQLSDRANLVRAFAEAYGEGGWRGLEIPVDEVRRLAHPELANVVRELWGAGPANGDVREFLVEMIWQGPIAECVDLAEAAALDTTWDPYQRIVAVRALLSCNAMDASRRVVDQMLKHPEAWPARIVRGSVEEVFPAVISVDELAALLKRTPDPDNSESGLSWTIRRIVQSVDPTSDMAVSLRDEFAQLIFDERSPQLEFYRIHGERDYLVPALILLCERQLAAGCISDEALIHSCVVAARFGNEDRDADEPTKQLREHFHDAAMRRELFWADLDLMDELVPEADEWHRLYHVLHGSLLGSPEQADRAWLEVALKDESHPRRRPVALHALIELWRQRGTVREELEGLHAAVKGQPTLETILEERTATKLRDPEIERQQRKSHRRRMVSEGREQQRLQDWKVWREKLIANPEEAFSPGKLRSTMHNVYIWLSSLDRDRGKYNVWNKEQLVRAFGPNVALLAEAAFKAKWRTTVPELWSVRRAADRNSTPYSWIYGLCGLSVESLVPGWTHEISPKEARLAVAYATVEMNGFARFIGDLAQSHPAEVDAVLGEELSAELVGAGDHQHLPMLQDLTHADLSVKRLMVPRLLTALPTWPGSVTEETASRWSHHLDQVLRVLNDAGEEASNHTVAEQCAYRFVADPTGPLAMTWLQGLFRFDADRGAQVLAAQLATSRDIETKAHAVAVFATLFGERDTAVLKIEDPQRRATVLSGLVRSAYAFVRREEDQEHEGTYHPDTRDRAETARNFLLSALLETPGPEARQEILALASEPDFAHFPDRLRLLARQRAAADAEFAALTPDAVVALETRFEAPPQDRDGLFAVMMDRLEDLAHDIAHHDFTDRRTLRSITEEAEMQRTLSLRLELKANGAYLITREEEVADRKETDIRFRATITAQKAVAEIKLADNGYSLADLERALRDQLVGQYLRHVDSKAGCLLLTYRGEKSYWQHPSTGAHIGFQEVVAHLEALAQTLEADASHGIRVSVFGLDLTDPVLAPAHG